MTKVEPAPHLARARVAVTLVFLVNAFAFATWVVNIPLVQAKLRLSEGALGLTLLTIAVGGLVAMPLSGFLINRFGSRRVTRVSIAIVAMLPILPLTANTLTTLVASLFLLGAFQSVSAVAMSTQAVAVEDRLAKPVMSSFHGFWSVGSIAGAGFGGLLISFGATPLLHACLVTVLLAFLLSFALPNLLDGQDARVGQQFARPTGPHLLLGLLTFFALMSEGAVADWGAVYLSGSLGILPGAAAAGFAVFSPAMAVGRFAGDALNRRMGMTTLLRSSALLAGAGLTLTLAAPTLAAALTGFGLLGFGLANLIPLLYGAAARAPGLGAGAGVAAVTVSGYVGYLVGPPLIGLGAEVVSLRVMLAVLVPLLLSIAVVARRVEAL